MPTSATESDKLLEITLRRMAPQDALEFARDLNRELGAITDNDSLRITLRMALERAEHLAPLPPIPLRDLVLLRLVVFAHGLVILGNIVSAAVLAIWTCLGWSAPAWAVVCPIVTFVVWASTSKNYDCPITRLEDWMRAKHRRPPIKAFLKHYLVDPIQQWRSS